jgi:hypothetical protein
MRVIAEQPLPTDLGTLRKFVDKATRLVEADVTSVVSYQKDGYLRVCAAKELEDEK